MLVARNNKNGFARLFFLLLTNGDKITEALLVFFYFLVRGLVDFARSLFDKLKRLFQTLSQCCGGYLCRACFRIECFGEKKPRGIRLAVIRFPQISSLTSTSGKPFGLLRGALTARLSSPLCVNVYSHFFIF